MRNIADVTGGKPIAVLLHPLVAFYNIHGGKREVLLFYNLYILFIYLFVASHIVNTVGNLKIQLHLQCRAPLGHAISKFDILQFLVTLLMTAQCCLASAIARRTDRGVIELLYVLIILV
jgi:hypothetical protein